MSDKPLVLLQQQVEGSRDGEQAEDEKECELHECRVVLPLVLELRVRVRTAIVKR